MKNNIYLLRDTVTKTVKSNFAAVNDGAAVRSVCDWFRDDPHYSDYELWRFGVAYDVETMEKIDVERAVIALPSRPADAPKMPLSDGVAKVELKQ